MAAAVRGPLYGMGRDRLIPESSRSRIDSSGPSQGCAHGVRVIAANHVAARDNAGKRHAQGRVGGAGTRGVAIIILLRPVGQSWRNSSTADFPQAGCHGPCLWFSVQLAPCSPLSIHVRYPPTISQDSWPIAVLYLLLCPPIAPP
ncbi:rna helicase [Lasius niger]|uniref:Rna helicase n=1 Tax=Lasius niger TaxID=67767 RepID=A0A0J7MNR5_LASNI|nr:rna helicase [Lasius niger]